MSPPPARLRPDLQAVADMVPDGRQVLDLGCGDGALLAYLAADRDVTGRGIELSERNVLACVRRGLSVRQGHLVEGLADYPDGRFDVVILCQTLPYLNDPGLVLREMLRVGRSAIVSFPNWGHWRSRLGLLVTGRMPTVPDVPQQWHEAPRLQAFTISDFTALCRQREIAITAERFLSGARRRGALGWPNWRATTAVFRLSAGTGASRRR